MRRGSGGCKLAVVPKILVTGSIAYDLLLTYDGSFADAIDPAALQSLSVAFVTPHFSRHFGGCGANIAWGLALLGQEPLLVSTVGTDGDPYVRLLRDRGISLRYVGRADDRMTATAIVASDAQERQITFYHPGADACGTWPDLSKERGITHAIVSPCDTSMMLPALRWCAGNGIPTLFDPGQQIGVLGNDDLLRGMKNSAGIIANAYEWDQIGGRLGLSPKEALETVPMVIVTEGEKGLTIHSRDGALRIAPCIPGRVVNPTGAGDALRAGFLTGLSHGWSIEQCGHLGAAMGSFAVEEEGTLLEHLDARAVWERAEETYGEVLPQIGAF